MPASFPPRRRQVLSGAVVLLVLQLGYISLWWNKGIQLNSTGMPTLAGSYILAGKLPYLDFHFWCPPAHILIHAALTSLFGDALIYVRAFAVAERMAIFLVVYFWLTRMFSVPAAFFGVAAAAAGFSSDVGDTIAHYNFDALLAAVSAGLAASVALDAHPRKARWLFFVTGAFAGICCLAKQTQGVGISLLFPVIFFLTTKRLAPLLQYSLGWLLPVSTTALWLWQGGAWTAFLNQTLLGGTSSKGSLSAILFRPLISLTQSKMLLSAFVAALFAACAFTSLLYRGKQQAKSQRLFHLALLAAASFAAGLAWAYSPWIGGDSYGVQKFLATYSAFAIFLTLISNGAAALYFTAQSLRGELDASSVQKWMCASLSFLTAYMFSLSWAAFEPMLIPGLAFLLAWTLDRQKLRGPVLAAVALACILITTAVVRKMTWPYAWENWNDGTIKAETASVDFPEMRGLRVTPANAAFLTHVTNVIDEHSRPGETIFCFPNFAFLYVLAHRTPATFAFMHWFDIVSDALCRQDAARIREHPPAVILFSDLPEKEIHRMEIAFRGGKRSGQRDLIDTLRSLPGYRLLETVPIPNIDAPLRIYVRDSLLSVR